MVTPSIAPPSISKAEPSISEDPAVNLPPSVKALMVVGVIVLIVKVFEEKSGGRLRYHYDFRTFILLL